MKKKTIYNLLLLLLMLFPAWGMCQEESEPVMFTFESGLLIENQTIETPYPGTLEFNIHHRMGMVDNGISDLFGIYGASNIRLGLNYGVTDRIMVGFGTEKDRKLQEFQWKYAILKQTTDNSMPVSLSYYGNWVINAQDKSNFGPAETYRFIHRMSYLTQFIVARKFSENISLQIAPSFAYFNSVEPDVEHITGSVMGGGRIKFTPSMAFIFEYEQPLVESEAIEVKPNLAGGIEIGTATHAFQVFVTSYKGIVKQYDLLYNTNDFTEGKLLVGFNITARL
jgi:hypothetical protein